MSILKNRNSASRFLKILWVANVLTILPAIVLITLFYGLVLPLAGTGDGGQGAGMAFGLMTLPFILAGIPVLLLNIISLPILLVKADLADDVRRKSKIILWASIAATVMPIVILVINNLFINPQ